VGKRGEGQGPLGKTAILLPPPDPKQRREAGTVRRPAKGGAPAVLPLAAAGIGLKRERRPRGNRSRAHLVLGRSEEAAPR
jgi:hypothetical protein